MAQEQFLNVIDRDKAERRFQAALQMKPLGDEMVSLSHALGRIAATDVISPVDVPSFDRSNFDGYAVRAADTHGASEERPKRLKLLPGSLTTGIVPHHEVTAGTALQISTGAVVPRGADAVVLVEHSDEEEGELLVRRAVIAGGGVSFAGTDISAGEIVLRRGEILTSRETGMLAAVGVTELSVWRRPLVAIVSTGDEIIAPGQTMRPGLIYDSNAQILADAVTEQGGQPLQMGIVRDDLERLREVIQAALGEADLVLLSGGTSKGEGDLCYRAVSELPPPGILAHGVALKPGKPICLAVTGDKPVVILPGFPTSAIFTFHEFVAPVLRAMAGRRNEVAGTRHARLAVKVNSEVGRTEYLLVGLAPNSGGELVAYPVGGGSGSVTTFSRADGFITIPRHAEIAEKDSLVTVTLLGRDLPLADLVVIGSHCTGLDYLLGVMQERGFHTRFLAVGSTAGLQAARRGECDLAGMHLLDPDTGIYNQPFVTDDLLLIKGYGRQQGIVFRPGDARFTGPMSPQAIVHQVKDLPDCIMVNRNAGSGTRVLIDRLLEGAQPPGYAVQARNHSAVAAAVAQGRADWGVAIEQAAKVYQLGFLPLAEEEFDFVIPRSRLSRPAIEVFGELLDEPAVRAHLEALGFAMYPRG